MDLNLRGRSALITGGSRGIGYGIARSLAAEGCHLHLASRSAADLEAARKTLEAEFGVKVTCHAGDLSDGAKAAALARSCADVDFLINNAGAIPHGPLSALDDATLRTAWDLKLFGFLSITRELYAAMCQRKRGVIVNIIGVAGERPVASYIGGSIANAGLMAMSKALGAESPKFGVRVIGINPGSTETDRQIVRWRAKAEKELGSADRWREITTGFPFGRLATVAEVADTVAFLCSERSGYTTGTVITIDGGATAQR